MKLTKQQARLHAQAEAMLTQDALSYDDKLFVLEHWREDANQPNAPAGARRLADICYEHARLHPAPIHESEEGQ